MPSSSEDKDLLASPSVCGRIKIPRFESRFEALPVVSGKMSAAGLNR